MRGPKARSGISKSCGRLWAKLLDATGSPQPAADSCGAARRLQEAVIHERQGAFGAADVQGPASAHVISDVGGGAACVDDGDAAPQAERAGAAGHQERDGNEKCGDENSVHTHSPNANG